MRILRTWFLIVVAVWFSACLGSAEDPQTSYSALHESEVRGLTSAEIESLRNGDGMGYALPAELNGYPGPKHVLELADRLGLNEDQRNRTLAVRGAMLDNARRTGSDLVAAYAALDHEFRAGNMSVEQLRRHTEKIGVLEGELRAIHMEAHLEMMRILTMEQVQAYGQFRGYATTEGHEHGHERLV